MSQPLIVTAVLASPLAGDPPQLDALLEWVLSPFSEPSRPAENGHYKITRAGPAPKMGGIAIPLLRKPLGPWGVACCSNPILPLEKVESVDYVCKRVAVEAADLLLPSERKVMSTTNTWTKSYRLPLKIRRLESVRWLCFGSGREIRKCLKDVHSIGKKVSDGYGRVTKWLVEEASQEAYWFADHPTGTVLMRTLPLGDWLPKDLIGFRRRFGACCPPYWHSERFTEIVEPC